MERTEQRNQIVRSESRLIAGVCGGLAVHLGIPVNYLRIGFLGLTALGGAGVLLYAWLWVFTPSAEESKAGALRSRGTGPRTLAEEMGRVQQGIFSPREMSEKLSSWRETLIGAALLLVALLALGQWLGLNIRWDLIWPSLGIIAGVLLAWLQVDGQHLDGDRKAKALVFGRLI
ncbi:PspC domain-containing protein, partial [Glutamicibacter sp. AOP38-B1-38]